jgi:hypothetical protein
MSLITLKKASLLVPGPLQSHQHYSLPTTMNTVQKMKMKATTVTPARIKAYWCCMKRIALKKSYRNTTCGHVGVPGHTHAAEKTTRNANSSGISGAIV